jgi:hypothetical protein
MRPISALASPLTMRVTHAIDDLSHPLIWPNRVARPLLRYRHLISPSRLGEGEINKEQQADRT